MRRHNGGRLYSARDLNRFLECRHCTWIDLLDLEVPHDRTTADEQTLLVREKGIEHEQAYLDSLRDRGLSVVEIPANKPLEHRVEQTRTAIGDGVDAIYQAALMSGSWHGFADFLRRTGSNPARYECIDTKLGRTPGPHHLI